MLNENYVSKDYDYTQRAYLFEYKEGGGLNFELLASDQKPIHNLVLVVYNWQGSESSLKLNGETISPGKDFRQAIEYDVEGNKKLIVFIKHKSNERAKINLSLNK